MTAAAPVLTWLYAPGDRPERLDKAVANGADVVVVDWEDSVTAGRKDLAREATLNWLRASDLPVPIEIRVNGTGTPWFEDDLAALADGVPNLASVRLPKTETVDQLTDVAAHLPDGVTLTGLIETALGVENAFTLATASDRMRRIGLGEADLAADLGVADDAGLQWARSRIVVAARAAGLPAPAMSVWTDLADEAGLIASTRQGRHLGLLGRAAVHPRQLAPIRAAFRPDAAEIAAARRVVDALADGDAIGLDAHGRMIDAAVVRMALAVLSLADRPD